MGSRSRGGYRDSLTRLAALRFRSRRDKPRPARTVLVIRSRQVRPRKYRRSPLTPRRRS